MRFVAVLAVVLAALSAAPVSAAPDANLRIQPGVAIGKLRLGMTEAAVRRAMGKPRFVIERRGAFGLTSIEYQYGLAEYTVRLSGPRGRRRAVRVGTTLLRERTPRGVGVGSLERTVRRLYPMLGCRPLRTVRYGSVPIVTTIQRECTLFGPSGRRTIFTTDVLERRYEPLTLQVWARRAQVVEVSVARAA